MRRFLYAAALSVVVPAALSAQSLRQQTSGASTSAPMQVISTNPFLPLWGWFQGEYERRVNANAALAIGLSHTEWDDDVYNNVDVKLRLYPQENALQGLGLAAGIGVSGIRRAAYDDCTFLVPECVRVAKRNITAPTFAVEAQYQWLLGTRKATAVTVGGGVKRYFVDKDDFNGNSRVHPTGRLSIGYAF